MKSRLIECCHNNRPHSFVIGKYVHPSTNAKYCPHNPKKKLLPYVISYNVKKTKKSAKFYVLLL